ncbi:MAG TPA: hypothetical protein VKT81_05700 [Bryobacteraceae bacterium]|nr:hypothetical protein [Bryobacteraceae bacterium]
MLVFACFCNIYNVHEYRVHARHDRVVNNVEYFWQHSPGTTERISQGLNFPALVMDFPLKDKGEAIYERNSDFTLIWIGPREIGFFVAVFLLWHIVGRTLDRRHERNSRIRPRGLRTAVLAAGLLFGICIGVYAYQMILLRWLPMREIGLCGFAWAITLVTYFGWRLLKEFFPDKNAAELC